MREGAGIIRQSKSFRLLKGQFNHDSPPPAFYEVASIQATPAIVVSKRSRGSGDSSSNYLTFEFEDGQRQEYRIAGLSERPAIA